MNMDAEPTGVYFASDRLPEGVAIVGNRMYNIQDGKEYPACMVPAAVIVGVMFAIALLAVWL